MYFNVSKSLPRKASIFKYIPIPTKFVIDFSRQIFFLLYSSAKVGSSRTLWFQSSFIRREQCWMKKVTKWKNGKVHLDGPPSIYPSWQHLYVVSTKSGPAAATPSQEELGSLLHWYHEKIVKERRHLAGFLCTLMHTWNPIKVCENLFSFSVVHLLLTILAIFGLWIDNIDGLYAQYGLVPYDKP